MILQSNTSFGQYCKSKEKEFKTRLEYLEWYEKARDSFDNFLLKHLKLGMFVPCDENDVPLDEPNPEFFNFDVDAFNLANNQYQQAKERVLFEVFFISENQDTKPTDVKSVTNGGIHIFWFNNEKGWYLSFGLNTIEDLVKYKLKLTDSAIKQLNL